MSIETKIEEGFLAEMDKIAAGAGLLRRVGGKLTGAAKSVGRSVKETAPQMAMFSAPEIVSRVRQPRRNQGQQTSKPPGWTGQR